VAAEAKSLIHWSRRNPTRIGPREAGRHAIDSETVYGLARVVSLFSVVVLVVISLLGVVSTF
jgi:hypothetical protein